MSRIRGALNWHARRTPPQLTAAARDTLTTPLLPGLAVPLADLFH
jgi:hypothetical protein